MSDGDESADLTPRFDLEEGKGTPLGELPCFTTTPTRGAAAKSLEAALEPLHRLVYSRPGVGGTRRSALQAFKGFPPSMESDVRQRLKKLVKAKLRDLVVALGMGVHVSLPVEALADGVADFLMAPADNGKIKAAKSSPAKKSSRSAATSPSSSQPPAKKSKTESPAHTAPVAKPQPAKTPSASAARPTDAEIQVHVYQRVLAMDPSERATLGVKALRVELEGHFGVAEGALKDRKDLIADTASSCVRALLEAERRAALVADAQATTTAAETRPPQQASVAVPATPQSPAEPTPSPVWAPGTVDSLAPSAPNAPAAPFPHQPL